MSRYKALGAKQKENSANAVSAFWQSVDEALSQYVKKKIEKKIRKKKKKNKKYENMKRGINLLKKQNGSLEDGGNSKKWIMII